MPRLLRRVAPRNDGYWLPTGYRRGSVFPLCSLMTLALLMCVVAGCAQRDRSDDENHQGGFYGGVSIGR